MNSFFSALERMINKVIAGAQTMDTTTWVIVSLVTVFFGYLCLRGNMINRG